MVITERGRFERTPFLHVYIGSTTILSGTGTLHRHMTGEKTDMRYSHAYSVVLLMPVEHQKVRYYILSRDGVGSKWPPTL